MAPTIRHPDFPPIIIGGLPGSGTRAVTEVMMASDIYMGNDLNRSSDDLTFTLLFKRPKSFFSGQLRNRREAGRLMELHEAILFGRTRTAMRALPILLSAAAGHQFRERRYRWSWVARRVKRAVTSKPPAAGRWGWKEPHAIFFLNTIKERYPDAYYIHVIRHGYDMVYSHNQQMLTNWGAAFGVDPGDMSERNRFEFWYRGNKQALAAAKRLFPGRTASISMEDMCRTPTEQLNGLFSALNIPTDLLSPKALSIPRLPSSVDRYNQEDLSWSSPETDRMLFELHAGSFSKA